MRRYLEPQLLRDLARKAVVLTGARQVGKTTLARQLISHLRSRLSHASWSAADFLNPAWRTIQTTPNAGDGNTPRI